MTPDPKHPITDLDARFCPVHPSETPAVIEALRKAGVYFDVTVNAPKDQSEAQRYDIFWFRKEDDMEMIGAILRATCTK